MKMIELGNMLAAGKEVDVEFAQRISDQEGYTEPGMRATILSITDIDNDGVIAAKVSYAKYDEYNKAFESHNYWGVLSKGQDPSSAQYTARETGWYKVEETIYLMADDEVESYMTLLTRNELFDEWNASDKEVSYTAWLENLVRQVSRLSTLNL